MRIALFCCFALAASLLGQQSQQKQTQLWGGLKFGMTVAEARKTLPYRSNALGKRDQVPGRSVPGVMGLRVPRGVMGAVPVTAAVYFREKGNALSGVLLASDHEGRNYCDMPGNLEKQAATLLWETFLAELKKQNGEPSSSSTEDGENSSVSTRLAVWDGNPGLADVTLLLMGSCKRIDVTVTFTPAGFRKR